MKIKNQRPVFARRFRFILVLVFVFSPMAANLSFALEETKAAVEAAPVKVLPVSDEEAALLKQLAKQDYFGDKKDSILKAKSLSQDQLVEALAAVSALFSKVDPSSLKDADKAYRAEDIQALLKLVKAHKDALWAKKAQVWSLEKKLNKIVEALEAPGGEEEEKEAAVPTPKPQPTAVPVVTKADWDEMKGTVKDLSKKTEDIRGDLEKKTDLSTRESEGIKKAQDDLGEQLKLVKRIMDQVQSNLGKLEDRVDVTSKKAAEKTLTDDELKQELTILRKDLRDNSQDVSILKQQLAKLDKTGEVKAQSPLDDALSSKWLVGGALAVGLAALVISLTRK